METISVVVPVYNVCEYLSSCVESICHQTYQQLEIILVDDGSTDGSGVLCDRLAAKDARIRVIHQENRGLSAARNTGIEAASGTWIAFVDSDDWIDTDMLELLHRLAVEEQAQIVECGWRNVMPDGVIEETSCTAARTVGNGIDGIRSLLYGAPWKVAVWNKLYHRDVIGNVRFPQGLWHEDEYTTHRFFWNAKKMLYVDVSRYNYRRQRAGSITSSTYQERHIEAAGGFRDKWLFLKKHGVKELNHQAAQVYSAFLLRHLKNCVLIGANGPYVQKAIKWIKKDFRKLRRDGIEDFYLDWLEILWEDGYQKFGEECRRQDPIF